MSMRSSLGVAWWLVIAIIGCSSGDSPTNGAGGACKLTESANACVRCWAEKCPTQLDYCYGAGFHAGDLISASTANNAVACWDFSKCLQTCGCYDRCFETCAGDVRPACTDCQQKYFSACRMEKCSAECSAPDGGS